MPRPSQVAYGPGGQACSVRGAGRAVRGARQRRRAGVAGGGGQRRQTNPRGRPCVAVRAAGRGRHREVRRKDGTGLAGGASRDRGDARSSRRQVCVAAAPGGLEGQGAVCAPGGYRRFRAARRQHGVARPHGRLRDRRGRRSQGGPGGPYEAARRRAAEGRRRCPGQGAAPFPRCAAGRAGRASGQGAHRDRLRRRQRRESGRAPRGHQVSRRHRRRAGHPAPRGLDGCRQGRGGAVGCAEGGGDCGCARSRSRKARRCAVGRPG